MKKGESTRQVILTTGLNMASQLGLECVTIGALAKAVEMSKSGLFAHFQSKENLQIEILNHAADLFAEKVVIPALRAPSGIIRIKSLIAHWIEWSLSLSGGCIFVSASTEFSDRNGKVRQCLLRQQDRWMDALTRIARSAIKSGDFKEDADCEQFAFDLYSLMLGTHYYYKLLEDKHTHLRQEISLNRLLDAYRRS